MSRGIISKLLIKFGLIYSDTYLEISEFSTPKNSFSNYEFDVIVMQI